MLALEEQIFREHVSYLHFTCYYAEPGCWINCYKLYCLLSRKLNEIKLQLFKMYLLLLFRFYLLQTVEQAASPATKKMKPEGKWKLLSY